MIVEFSAEAIASPKQLTRIRRSLQLVAMGVCLQELATRNTRGWVAGSPNPRRRLKVELNRADVKVVLRRFETRIRDVRMAQLASL
jgi:hypothetical protein